MKPSSLVSLALLMFCLVWPLRAEEPPISFIGVGKQGEAVQVAVKSNASNRTSWLKLGQTFEGYTLQRLESSDAVLVVAKGRVESRLPLVEAKVKQGAAAEPPPEVKRQILNNLRMLSSAADQFFLEHGVTRTTYDDLVGTDPKKYIKQIVPAAGEDYRTIEFAQGNPLTVRTPQGYVMSYEP